MGHVCVARGRVERQESGRPSMRRIVGVPVDAASGPFPCNPEGRPILAPDRRHAPLAMRRIAARLAPSPGLKAGRRKRAPVKRILLAHSAKTDSDNYCLGGSAVEGTATSPLGASPLGSACSGPRKKRLRRKPGAKTESGLTETCGSLVLPETL